MKKVSELNIAEIERKIGYTFRDKSLLTQAFTRTSFCNEVNLASKVKYHSNEVLEFFGDGVLSLSIISFLLKECTERYEHGIRTELGEGDFSNIKSKLSDKQNLSKSMKALQLEKHLLMGEGDLKLGIQNEPSVMEDLFESIVGAIFIDSDMNMQSVIKAVSGMLDMSVYTDRQKISQSAKNALQEWCADKKRRLPAPRYETLSEDGPDHKKTYMRGCYIGEELMGRGIGKNFKLADAAAAEDALKALMAQNEQNMQSKVVENINKQTRDESVAKKIKSGKDTNGVSKPVASKEVSVVVRVKKSAGHAQRLREYATANKKPSPSFRDLGEKKNGRTVECTVECSFVNSVTLGSGATRLEARENAARLMIEKIEAAKKLAKTPSKKIAAKKSTEAKNTKDHNAASVETAKAKAPSPSNKKAATSVKSMGTQKSKGSKSKPAAKKGQKKKTATV